VHFSRVICQFLLICFTILRVQKFRTEQTSLCWIRVMLRYSFYRDSVVMRHVTNVHTGTHRKTTRGATCRSCLQQTWVHIVAWRHKWSRSSLVGYGFPRLWSTSVITADHPAKFLVVTRSDAVRSDSKHSTLSTDLLGSNEWYGLPKFDGSLTSRVFIGDMSP